MIILSYDNNLETINKNNCSINIEIYSVTTVIIVAAYKLLFLSVKCKFVDYEC
jgi:hypothetical protein